MKRGEKKYLMDGRYGRFLDYAVLDELTRRVQFSYSSQLVAITVPHFWDRAGKL